MKVTYKCKHCYRLSTIDNFWKWFITPHLGAKKRLKCKSCGVKSWMTRCDGRSCLDLPWEKLDETKDR